jgi:nucleotide-binding universal stress UspA family protein
MFDNVIVGVDGGRAHDASALAQALCTGTLTLVTAYPGTPGPTSRVADEYFELLRLDALQTLETARDGAGFEAELVTVSDPSPARALQAVAKERGADLIVLGSAHHGPVGRILAGDMGRGVLQAAPCPVAVAPRGFDRPRSDLHRVAVGFDGSAEAHAALALAEAWTHVTGAVLTAIAAWDVPAAMFTGERSTTVVAQMADEWREWITDVAQRAVAGLPRAEARVVRGPAPRVLAEATEESDLMFVGSRGWGPARRIALGSTSDHLVHHAACPVVVVPRPAAVERGESHTSAVDRVATT